MSETPLKLPIPYEQLFVQRRCRTMRSSSGNLIRKG
jgi:hypothetical protein